MHINTGNLFERLPPDLKEESFEELLQAGQVKLERIVSKGHASPEGFWYDQPLGEWVLLLQGAAVVQIEGQDSQRLEPGGYLNLPAHTRHRVEWTDPEQEAVWLAVHYP